MGHHRRRVTIAYDSVSLDVIVDERAEARTTPLVILPSSSRNSEDFDTIAESFAMEGFRVLRPQPRGMCGSSGPMEGLTLHDYARDVAVVIERLRRPSVRLGACIRAMDRPLRGGRPSATGPRHDPGRGCSKDRRSGAA